MAFYDAIHATKRFVLGTRIKDKAAKEYIYLSGVASTAAGSWVTFDEAHLTLLAVANAQGRVAISLTANTSATNYAWYQIYGKAVGKALTGFADNGKVYLTATAGSVDDADVAGDVVIGAIGRSALDTPTTGMAYFELSYPVVLDLAID